MKHVEAQIPFVPFSENPIAPYEIKIVHTNGNV